MNRILTSKQTPLTVRLTAGLILLGSTIGGCQAHAPVHGTRRTEDVSQVIYNNAWMKYNVTLRNLVVNRLEGNLLQVTAQLHSLESHTQRLVQVRTEFYSPKMDEDGVIVDTTDWKAFVLDPRKRVQYTVNSLVPADDFRIYVYYGEDIGKP